MSHGGKRLCCSTEHLSAGMQQAWAIGQCGRRSKQTRCCYPSARQSMQGGWPCNSWGPMSTIHWMRENCRRCGVVSSLTFSTDRDCLCALLSFEAAVLQGSASHYSGYYVFCHGGWTCKHATVTLLCLLWSPTAPRRRTANVACLRILLGFSPRHFIVCHTLPCLRCEIYKLFAADVGSIPQIWGNNLTKAEACEYQERLVTELSEPVAQRIMHPGGASRCTHTGCACQHPWAHKATAPSNVLCAIMQAEL